MNIYSQKPDNNGNLKEFGIIIFYKNFYKKRGNEDNRVENNRPRKKRSDKIQNLKNRRVSRATKINPENEQKIREKNLVKMNFEVWENFYKNFGQ